MVFACSCAKRMIQIYKNIQKPRTNIAFLLFVDTSLEVYSQNNPCVSISQSIEKNRIIDDGLFDYR